MFVLPAAEIASSAWDQFVSLHHSGWLWHTTPWLRYQAARDGVVDRSYGVVSPSGHLVGICPLMDDGGSWTFEGEPGPVPLSASDDAADAIHAHLRELERDYRPSRIAFRSHPGAPTGLVCPLGWTDLSWQTQVLDLAPSLDDLLHGFRDANRKGRTDVRKVAEAYPLETDWRVFLPNFRAVHEAFWGEPVLNHTQWGLIAGWLFDGTARLFGVPGQAWVLVYAWKGWAYYASGPSLDRHAGLAARCQWAAIQALKADGVQRYELGWHARSGEDAKHAGIAAFKHGFGGDAWTVSAAEVRR